MTNATTAYSSESVQRLLGNHLSYSNEVRIDRENLLSSITDNSNITSSIPILLDRSVSVEIRLDFLLRHPESLHELEIEAKRLIQETPDDCIGHRLQALISGVKGNFDESISSQLQAMKIASDGELWIGCKEDLANLFAIKYLLNHQMADAAESFRIFQDLIWLEEKEARHFYNAGRIAFGMSYVDESQSYDVEAMKLFKTAHDLNPQNPYYLKWLAHAYTKIDYLKEATECNEKAADLFFNKLEEAKSGNEAWTYYYLAEDCIGSARYVPFKMEIDELERIDAKYSEIESRRELIFILYGPPPFER